MRRGQITLLHLIAVAFLLTACTAGGGGGSTSSLDGPGLPGSVQQLSGPAEVSNFGAPERPPMAVSMDPQDGIDCSEYDKDTPLDQVREECKSYVERLNMPVIHAVDGNRPVPVRVYQQIEQPQPTDAQQVDVLVKIDPLGEQEIVGLEHICHQYIDNPLDLVPETCRNYVALARLLPATAAQNGNSVTPVQGGTMKNYHPVGHFYSPSNSNSASGD